MAELVVVRNYTHSDLIHAGEPGYTGLTDKRYKPNRTPPERHIANGYFDPVWKSPEFTGKFSGDQSDIAMLTPAIPSDIFSGFSGFMIESGNVLQAAPTLCIRIGDEISGDDIDLTKNYKDIEPVYPSKALAAWDSLTPAKSITNQKLTHGGLISTFFWGLEGNTRAVMPPYLQIGIVLGGTEADATVKVKLYANYL